MQASNVEQADREPARMGSAQMRTNTSIFAEQCASQATEAALHRRSETADTDTDTRSQQQRPGYLGANLFVPGSKTLELARQLQESLRILLEPTKANQLQYVSHPPHALSYWCFSPLLVGKLKTGTCMERKTLNEMHVNIDLGATFELASA